MTTSVADVIAVLFALYTDTASPLLSVVAVEGETEPPAVPPAATENVTVTPLIGVPSLLITVAVMTL
jgi:hypothetical protein